MRRPRRRLMAVKPVRTDDERRGVFTRRALFIMTAQGAALGGLGWRLYQLQVEDGGKYRTMADSNRISTRLLAPPRGRIVDRFGEVLAGNKLNWRALLLADETDDLPLTLDRFSAIVPLDQVARARITREANRRHRFIPVMLRDFLTWDDMARIEVAAPDLPGVIIDVGTTRIYPQAEKLAHVVGYVAPPNDADETGQPLLALPGMRVGRAGIERNHEVELRGDPGSVQMEVNAAGRVIRELDRHEGGLGTEVTLTIDAGLQRSVLDHLADQSASAVVMDCTNGEVIAMVSNPSFDPSLFDSGVSQAQWAAWNSPDAQATRPLINKAVAGLYPPGSTFKPAVAISALQAGTLSPDDRINCPGYIDVGGVRFHCWKKGGHGPLNLHGGIMNSCDVFFFEVARRTGMDRIAQGGHLLGLGVPLPIELPHVKSGVIPTPEWRRHHGHHWNGGDTINAGIGQGFVQVTPLALATYVSRLATGRAVQPHLTRALGGVVQTGSSPNDWPSMGLPEDQLHAVRDGMWAVVNDPRGTAPLARLPLAGVQMAGKTGSAQVRRVSRWTREFGHFDSSKLPWEFRPHALFICYAPYDAPRYAIAVVVEHGNAAAQVAAPLARDIMVDTLERNPSGKPEQPGETVADASRSNAVPGGVVLP